MSTPRLKSYLAGEWVDGTGPGAPLHDPTTEAVLAESSTQGLDLAAALEYGRTRGAASLRAMTFAERGAMLKALSKAVHTRRDELLELATANGGNTRGDAKFDVDGGTGTMMYYAGVGKRLGDARFLLDGDLEQLTRAPRYVGRHLLAPIPGVAVHINAFNFPAWGLMEKAAVALLAGVPVLAKPGTSTALVAHRVVEIAAASGVLPDGALQLLAGSAGDLLSHIRSGDAVAFTGSSGVGDLVRGRAGTGVRVNIEADSLNAVVLGPDVDDSDSPTWDLFMRQAVTEITQKAGQKCTATRRIFVPEALMEEVGEELAERLGEIRTGHPTLRAVKVGPLATRRQLDDVRGGVDRLRSVCDTLLGDGGRGDLLGIDDDKGWFMSPVLLRAPSLDTPAVHADEVFGPVATLVPYSGEAADAVRGVAMGQGGLVASVYTDDRAFARDALFGLAPYSGRVCIGSARVAEYATGPGMVMPQLIHGGPGRAGGGEELGGERGLRFYLQRTAVQGSKPLLEKLLG